MRFKHKVSLYKLVQVDDGAGGSEESRQLLIDTWGSFEPVTGSRIFQYGQIIDGKPYEIKMRYREDLKVFSDDNSEITRNLLLIFRNREFQIHSINIDFEERRFISIVAWEKA